MLKPFYDFVRNARDYGIGYVSGRYYSIYPGKVATEDDLKDEQSQNRVKVTCQPVTHRTDALSQYAYPVSPYAGKDKGFIFPPDEGDALWIAFDEGRPDLPRYLGSWWCNDDAQNSPKSGDNSFLPTEFRPAKDKRPTARGFKTKLGHGFLMEDDVEAELGHRVEMWSGEQKEAGKDAEKHHKLEFNDKDQFAQISSFGKEGDGEDERWQHAIRFDDKEEFVRVRSAGKSATDFHFFEMHDKDNYVRIQTSEKKMFLVFAEDDLLIQVKTEGDYTTKWDEKNKIITSTTPNREFSLDDNNNAILLKGPKQTFKLDDAAGTTLEDTSGQAISITSNGDILLDAKVNCNITAGANSTIDVTGAMEVKAASLKETITAAFEQTCATFKSTATSTHEFIGQVFKYQGTLFQINVGLPGGIQLGAGGTNLVNLAGSIKYNTHTHIVVGALPGVALPTSATMIPASDLTVTTVAA